MSRAGRSGNRSVSPRRVRGIYQCYGKEAPTASPRRPWFLALPACRLSGRHSLDRSRPPGCPPLVRHGEHPALVLRHVAGGHVLQAGPEFLDLAAKRHAGGGGLDEGSPPVAGVGPAADEAGSFQALDHPGHRGRVGIESRGEVGLRDPQLPCSTHIRPHRAATRTGRSRPSPGPWRGAAYGPLPTVSSGFPAVVTRRSRSDTPFTQASRQNA